MGISAADVAPGNVDAKRRPSDKTIASAAAAVCLRLGLCVTIAVLASITGCAMQSPPKAQTAGHAPPLQARIIAVGIAATAARGRRGAFLPVDTMHDDATPTPAQPTRYDLGDLGFDKRLPDPLPTGAAVRDGVAVALLSRSPNAGRRAIFAVVNADGSVVQVQAGKAVGALAPAGTIAPSTVTNAMGENGALTSRGIVFNWVPDPILYIADPNRNAVVALTLIDDGGLLRVEKSRRLDAAELNRPIDLTPAIQEKINPDFAAQTTLAGAADFYVANRGDGTIVRMRQDGTVLARRSIEVPELGLLGADRLDSIVVAPDAERIWVGISGELPPFTGLEGAILELPAFGSGAEDDLSPGTAARNAIADVATDTDVALQMGLGPSFNARSCADCHRSPVAGGMGPDGLATVLRIGRLDSQGYDPMLGRGGPVARLHSISELGVPCAAAAGIPPGANLISVRNAPALFGMGLVDEIPDATILAGAVARNNGIHGHPNVVADADGHVAVGRFGWKAQVPRLEQFVAEALRDEHGITSPLAPLDLIPETSRPGCGVGNRAPKDDGTLVHSLTAFVRSLEPMQPRARDAAGRAIFVRIGCADCHTPSLAARDKVLPLYADLLLHDMGPALNDGVVQGRARGRDWRTTPLWGLSVRTRFLHDGRARSVDAAILVHGGEADTVVQAYRKLDGEKRSALLAFLSSL